MYSTSSKLLSLALLAAPGLAEYVLKDDYQPATFFDQFNFFDTSVTADPTGGFVKYEPRNLAEQYGLIYTTSTNAVMRVDNTTVPQNGRSSVRIQSKNQYNHGLFILDLDHMPHGCGVWPAYWLVGPDWPNSGEIDIIENIQEASVDISSLHTSANCNLANTGAFSGSAGSTVSCERQPGCGITAQAGTSFGIPFNNAGGGVYATEWNADAISIWYFPRGSIPADITSGAPTVQGWGKPQAQFYKSGCDIESHFANMQIVFNTDFCGDWAGSDGAWQQCSSKAATCIDWVQNHPSAFSTTYWSIRSLKVYTETTTSAATKGAKQPEAAAQALYLEKSWR